MFSNIQREGLGAEPKDSRKLTLQSRNKVTLYAVHQMLENNSGVGTSLDTTSQQKLPPTPKTRNYQKLVNTFYKESSMMCFPISFDRFVAKHRQRCETIMEGGQKGKQSRRHYRIKNCKTGESESAIQLNRIIFDKMKSVANASKKKPAKGGETEVNLGLDIRSIKQLSWSPKKRERPEKRTIKYEMTLKRPYSKPSNLSAKYLKEQPKKSITNGNLIKNSKDSLKTSAKLSHNNLGHSKQVSEYKKRLLKMSACHELILNSFHCCLVDTVVARCSSQMTLEGVNVNKQLGQKRFSYYLGAGNNANLIRSVLRKRPWWREVDSTEKAHLVWTQLKVQAILEKSVRHSQTWDTSVVLYEQDDAKIQTIPKKREEETQITEQSWGKLFHFQQDLRYQRQLIGRQRTQRLQTILVPSVIHNHYEHNYMFGNKNALLYNISQYCSFKNMEVERILPQTYHIRKDDPGTMAQFEQVFLQRKKKGGVWVVKPAQNSNRGRGIQCTTSLYNIRMALAQYKKIVVQAYIKNLLLYNGRKFDVRTFLIALTIGGRLKFYWYEEGYMRTSSEMFDISCLDDRMVHLTNDAVQKKGDSYGKYEPGNKLSYAEFQRYLESKFPKDNIQLSRIHDKMRSLAVEAVRATYCRLDPARRQFSFELFGLDFIIDSQLKPYLIEVNTNPCLELSCPCLQRLIPRMVENMFRLVLDPVFRGDPEHSFSRNDSFYIYDHSFLNRNRFCLMFDEKYDCDFEWEEQCRKSGQQGWGEGQEEEYTDEGKLIVVEY